MPHLETARLRNRAFMEALFRLSWLSDRTGIVRWSRLIGQFGGLDKLGSGFVRPPISQPQVPSMHHLACVRPAWNVGVWHYSS